MVNRVDELVKDRDKLLAHPEWIWILFHRIGPLCRAAKAEVCLALNGERVNDSRKLPPHERGCDCKIVPGTMKGMTK